MERAILLTILHRTQPTENGAQINLRFPGQYYDNGTGMYYNLNRFYDPRLGRYWEADPLGLDGGLNPYAYAGNNPVMNIDPTGLFSLGKLSSIIDDIGHSASNAINNGIKGVKDYFKNGGTVGVSNDNTGYSITTNGMTSGGNSIDASMHVGGGSSISDISISNTTIANTSDYGGDRVVGTSCMVDCYYGGLFQDVGLTSYQSAIEQAVIRGNVEQLQMLVELGGGSSEETQLARLALNRLNMTGQQILSSEVRGSAARVFPSQYKNVPFYQIIQDSRNGIAAAKTALKLLKDGRFQK